MIPAKKNALFDFIFYRYVVSRMGKTFHSVDVWGLEHFHNLRTDRPVLGIANHISWWDGLAVFYLSRFQGKGRERSFYCMMEEKQLVHYQFFTWIGAFGVNLGDTYEAAVSLRYSLNCLKNTSHCLWVFPQGNMEAPEKPLEFQPGVTWLLKKVPNTMVIPVAFHYEFLREDKPHLLMNFGKPLEASECSKESLEAAVAELSAQLLKSRSEGLSSEFEAKRKRLLHPAMSINKRWEWWMRWMQGKLDEFDPEY